MNTASVVKYSIATAASAFFASLVLTSGAQASVTSKLLQCNGNTKDKVVSCCEHILKNKKRPVWMSSGRDACSAAVACSTKTIYPAATSYAAAPKKIKICKLVIHDEGGTSDDPKKTPQPDPQTYKQ